MRIAVLSDIHSNYYALNAVLNDLDQKVDAYWCLGDSAGRGFQPLDVLMDMQRIYERQEPRHRLGWLSGNHEMMLLNRIPHGKMTTEDKRTTMTVTGDNIFAAQMIEEHQGLLKDRPELLKWLESLHTYGQPHPNVYLAHAAYEVDDQGKIVEDETFRPYLLEESQVRDMLYRMKEYAGIASGLVMCGHTHISGLWSWDTASSDSVHYADHQRAGGYRFDLQQQLVYVNPGSVGFPRKTDICPTYVILETDDNFRSVTVEFFASYYDTSSIVFPRSYPVVYQEEMLKCRSYD